MSDDFTTLRRELSWRARRALVYLANGTPISTRMHWVLYFHDLVEIVAMGPRRSVLSDKGKAFAKSLKICLHEEPVPGPKHVYRPGKEGEWSVSTQNCPSCGATRRAINPDETFGYDAWSKDNP